MTHLPLNTVLDIWNRHRKFRFLFVGAINTVFNYFVVVVLYHFFTDYLNTVVIGVVTNIISITEGFIMQKIFVFRSKADWLKEYFKCFLVYIVVTVIYAIGLWLLCDIVGISIWITAIIMAAICCVISYIGLTGFTFRENG